MAKESKRNKKPEKGSKEKVDFYKSEVRKLRKRVDNLEARMNSVEKWIGKKITKEVKKDMETPETKREEMLKAFHPDHRDDDD